MSQFQPRYKFNSDKEWLDANKDLSDDNLDEPQVQIANEKLREAIRLKIQTNIKKNMENLKQ